MIETLKKLSLARGVTGDEGEVRELISTLVAPYADSVRTDELGSLIAFKKGRDSSKKLMVAAHMDEVGLIVKYINEDGLLKVLPMGGIDPRVVTGRKVLIGEKRIPGVICTKAIHLQSEEERKNAPDFKKLFIDIGAKDKKDAENAISLSDTAVFDSDFYEFGEGFIKGKALDNRCGCLSAIEAIKGTPYYDTYFVFTVEEEIGLRGAYAASYEIQPDFAIIVDTTTAADFEGIEDYRRSTTLGSGTVIFFIESTSIYKKCIADFAVSEAKAAGIAYQHKNVAVGGLDAGAVQRSRAGVDTLSIATPCRYLHSPSCVVKKSDLENTVKLLRRLVESKELLACGQ